MRTWQLPKKLLIACSSLFAAALDGNFSEANSKSVTLSEDDPDSSELLVLWLYVGALDDEGVFCKDPNLYVQA